MTGIDLLILAVIIVSGVISLLRGFLKEAISLIIWIAAVVVTLVFTAQFATVLPPAVESPTARLAVAGLTLFFGAMVFGALISWLFQKVVSSSAHGMTDRILGTVFGLLRGGLIVAVLVLMAHLLPAITQERWWQESALLPKFEELASAIHAQLPSALAGYFDFGQAG